MLALLLVCNLSFAFTVQNRCQHPIFVAVTEDAGVDWNQMSTIAWGWREIAPFSSSSDFPSRYASQGYKSRGVLVQYKGRTLTSGPNSACIDPANGFQFAEASVRPCRKGVLTKGFTAAPYAGTYEFTQCANTDAILRICNKSARETAQLAVLRHREGSWTSKGWYRVDANSSSTQHCREFNYGNRAAGSSVYYYAEYNRGETFWPSTDNGDGYFCVDRSNAFELKNAEADSTCSNTTSYKRVKGRKVILKEGTNTYNLN